jgi:superoxide reductase
MTSPIADLRRRDVARTALLAAASAVLPAAARAAPASPTENLVFTHDDPGHWAGKEALHVPVVTVADGVLTATTPHPMSEAHYIVSHSVVLEGGAFLGRAVFTPASKPVSTHALPAGYRGKVTVTSTCNLHDFWAATITV